MKYKKWKAWKASWKSNQFITYRLCFGRCSSAFSTQGVETLCKRSDGMLVNRKKQIRFNWKRVHFRKWFIDEV